MTRKYHYIIIISLMFLSACSKPQQGEIFFPKTAKGAQWEYGLRYVTPSGKHTGSMTISIGDEEKINGKRYYKQITKIIGVPGADTHTSYNRRSKDGIYKIDESSSARQEYLLIPFPIKPGDTWTTRLSGGQTRYTAEKIETVELNAKKYSNCLKVSVQGEKGTQHFDGFSYFAPGIGEVYTLLNLGEVKVDYAIVNYKL